MMFDEPAGDTWPRTYFGKSKWQPERPEWGGKPPVRFWTTVGESGRFGVAKLRPIADRPLYCLRGSIAASSRRDITGITQVPLPRPLLGLSGAGLSVISQCQLRQAWLRPDGPAA